MNLLFSNYSSKSKASFSGGDTTGAMSSDFPNYVDADCTDNGGEEPMD